MTFNLISYDELMGDSLQNKMDPRRKNFFILLSS